MERAVISLHQFLAVAAVAAFAALLPAKLPAETAPGAVVGEASARIEGGAESCGRGECPLGILVAEAMRAHALATDPDDTTGSGIVAALVPASALGAALAAGPVTPAALAAALPADDRLVQVEVTGADLLAALEDGAATLGAATPQLLQVAGLRYAVDPAQPTGQRVGEVRLWREAGSELIRHGNEWNVMRRSARWIRLDAEARYRLATTGALIRDADGSRMPDVTASEGPPLTQVVAAYLGAHSPYAPVRDGRIAIDDTGERFDRSEELPARP